MKHAIKQVLLGILIILTLLVYSACSPQFSKESKAKIKAILISENVVDKNGAQSILDALRMVTIELKGIGAVGTKEYTDYEKAYWQCFNELMAERATKAYKAEGK